MKIYLFRNQDDYFYNFDRNTNLLIVTGIPGSGKSYTSKELSNKYNYEIVSFDYLFDYEVKKPSMIEQLLIDNFISLYPEYSNFNKNRNNKYIVCNKFYDFVLDYVVNNNINIILDGTYFLKEISFNKYKNQRVIVKRTSFILSIIRETRRDILRQYTYDISLLKKLVRSIKLFIYSIFELSTVKYQNFRNLNVILSKLNY